MRATRTLKTPAFMLSLLLAACLTPWEAAADPVGPPAPEPLPANTSPSPFLDRYPALKTLLFKEPETPLKLGFGATPLSFMPGKVAVGLSALQVHYINDWLDFEILNASVDMALSGEKRTSRHFVFRTSPKYRVIPALSVGPLAGYEFVTFTDVQAQIAKGSYVGNPQPFSAQGLIFGGTICESFPLKDSKIFRVTQSVYKQTYSVNPPTADTFGYRFVDPEIDLDSEKAVVKAGTIFQIEFSLLF